LDTLRWGTESTLSAGIFLSAFKTQTNSEALSHGRSSQEGKEHQNSKVKNIESVHVRFDEWLECGMPIYGMPVSLIRNIIKNYLDIIFKKM
jgi:hypothetical protein